MAKLFTGSVTTESFAIDTILKTLLSLRLSVHVDVAVIFLVHIISATHLHVVMCSVKGDDLALGRAQHM